jgi:hypothetical protein
VRKQLRRRFWVEMGVALASMALLCVTVLWSDWIELVFRVDPDDASGALEWLILAAACAVAVAFLGLARAEWRRAVLHPA